MTVWASHGELSTVAIREGWKPCAKMGLTPRSFLICNASATGVSEEGSVANFPPPLTNNQNVIPNGAHCIGNVDINSLFVTFKLFKG